MLTICIPTFNRAEKLRQRLLELVPQLCDGVFILVVDNSSETPVRDKVIDIIEANPSIRVHRNKWNIGMSGNILRCLELAETEWIWLLGDDDVVLEDSLKKILNDIERAPHDVAVLKYSSYSGLNAVEETVDLAGFLDRQSKGFDYVANIFLISSTVLRIEKIDSIDRAMDNANCMVPHVIVIMDILSRGSRVLFLESELVRSTGEAVSWSMLRLTANLPRTPLFANGFDDKNMAAMIAFFSNHIHFSPWRLFVNAHKISKSGRLNARFAYSLAVFGDFKTAYRFFVVLKNIPFYFLFLLKVDCFLPKLIKLLGKNAQSRYERFMR